MYERKLRSDVIGHYDDPISFDAWMKPHRERAAQQAIDTEAALAVPINENSNETNGPQTHGLFIMTTTAIYPRWPVCGLIEF
jgi:hypothetical protein